MIRVVGRIRIAVVAAIAGLASLALPALAGVAVPARAQDQGGGTPSCIDYSGYARYRAYGYDHIVRVHNGCDKQARCDVWTNVTPDKHHISLQPDDTQEVVTRVGSPARAFTPRVSCELVD